MSANVDKYVSEIMEGFRSLVAKTVQKVDADARGEVLAQVNKAVNGGNGAAKAVAAPAKRKVGRPRKNPLPETAQASAEKPAKAKKKVKRVLSEETRQKLAENLKKARSAKADKSKPAKRKVGRPKKTATAPAAAAEQA